MTIEKLLGLSVDDWDKMTDEELKQHLEPYLKVTRPTKEVSNPSAKKSAALGSPSFKINANSIKNLMAEVNKKLNEKNNKT